MQAQQSRFPRLERPLRALQEPLQALRDPLQDILEGLQEIVTPMEYLQNLFWLGIAIVAVIFLILVFVNRKAALPFLAVSLVVLILAFLTAGFFVRQRVKEGVFQVIRRVQGAGSTALDFGRDRVEDIRRALRRSVEGFKVLGMSSADLDAMVDGMMEGDVYRTSPENRMEFHTYQRAYTDPKKNSL